MNEAEEKAVRMDEREKIAKQLLTSQEHKMYHAMNGGGFSPDWCAICRAIKSLGFEVTKEVGKKKKKG